MELELDIKHISEWMYQNHLKMNDTKTQFITHGSNSGLKKQILPEIRVGNKVIKNSESIKFLELHQIEFRIQEIYCN